jgi:hypothetical protein
MRQRVRNVWFQQDGAIAHTARQSMTFLRGMFPGHLVSQFGDIPWPAHSPDLTAPDFLWGISSLKCMLLIPTPSKNQKTALWELEQLMVFYCSELCRTSDSDYSNVSNVMEVIWNH